MLATGYTLSTTTERPFAGAVERVRAELKAEDFGIRCEIDVPATLKEKLGVDDEGSSSGRRSGVNASTTRIWSAAAASPEGQ